jgi:two-component system chemotaxis sensor kinase CheA
VERLHATVEIVVKPLGRHLKQLTEYAGATILGDGEVALILDVGGLAGAAGLEAHGALGESAEAAAAGSEVHQLLIFRNSPAETCGLPLHLVERVEKIRPEQVEVAAGRRSMQYRGRSLPLITLSDAARAEELRLDQDTVVVVLEMSGREIGLLGARPVDVVESDADIDPFTMRQPDISGSVIVRGRTTLILDAFELAERAWPGWKPEEPAAGGWQTAKLLVVDDSAFFRDQVMRLLESAGYAVVAAEDGAAAWSALEAHRDIALVVTDVEMPVMDGLALTRRIRGDARWAGLPILMLTSLAEEEDIRKGREAGATAYAIKMDRDELIATVRRLLAGPATPEGAEESGLAALSRRVAESQIAPLAEGEMK